MANVRVEQRNAHLAAEVRLETVAGRDGEISKATLTAISNSRKGSGENREEEPTAIQWTLWGKQAENAAQYLAKGSHVNVCGRLRNNHYVDGKGNNVFGFAFTCEEIDYLESKAASEARRAQHEGASGEGKRGDSMSAPAATAKAGRSRRAAKPQTAQSEQNDDVPF